MKECSFYLLTFFLLSHAALAQRSIPSKNKLPGGKTPEELGRLLVQAIASNNKRLWTSCIHPDSEVKEVLANSLTEIREALQESGLTNWKLLNFSRVTYKTNPIYGSEDNGIVNGEQVRRMFKVEFTYKNEEYTGAFGGMTIKTYRNRFFVMTKNSRAYLTR